MSTPERTDVRRSYQPSGRRRWRRSMSKPQSEPLWRQGQVVVCVERGFTHATRPRGPLHRWWHECIGRERARWTPASDLHDLGHLSAGARPPERVQQPRHGRAITALPLSLTYGRSAEGLNSRAGARRHVPSAPCQRPGGSLLMRGSRGSCRR